LALKFLGVPNIISIEEGDKGAFSGFQAPISWQPWSGWIPWVPPRGDQPKAGITSHKLPGDPQTPID